MPKGPNIRSHRVRVDVGEARLLRLIERCYDATLDASKWEAFLADYCDAMVATCAAFHLKDNRRAEFDFLDGFNFDLDRLADYGAYYNAIDPWVPPALKRPAGSLLTDEMLVSKEVFSASEIYNDYLEPQDIFHCRAIMFANDADHVGFLSVFRSERHDAFGAADERIAAAVQPHISRAAKLRRRFGTLETQRDHFRDGLDTIAQAIFLISEDGKVFHMNQSASTMIAEADGLDVRRGQLIATLPPATHALAQLLSGALAWFDNPLARSGGVVTIPRPSGRPSLSLFVSPLGKDLTVDERQGRSIAVMVSDSSRKPAAIGEHLATAYGLTPAEARLAEGLVHGGILPELAEQFGITPATARAQLRSVFQKTATNSQSELVRQVMLTLGSFPDG